MEADFQREYRLNLLHEADTLSWRRFLALLAGLSPHSAFLNRIAHRSQDAAAGSPRPRTARTLLSDPAAVARSIATKRRT